MKTSFEQFPTRRQVVRRSGKLEIIDIHNQVKLELRMKITRSPLLTDRSETDFPHLLITMILPKCSAVRMAVKSHDKGNNRLAILGPRRRAGLRREANPTRCSGKFRLDVSLFSVGNLDIVPRGTPVEVRRFRSLHRRRTAPQVLEHSSLPILVNNSIPLENNTPFELSLRMAVGQLSILFNTNGEKISKVNFDAGSLSIPSDFRPFFND